MFGDYSFNYCWNIKQKQIHKRGHQWFVIDNHRVGPTAYGKVDKTGFLGKKPLSLVCMYAGIHTYTRMHTFTRMHTNIHVHTCTHAHTHAYIQASTHAHTYIQTNKQLKITNDIKNKKKIMPFWDKKMQKIQFQTLKMATSPRGHLRSNLQTKCPLP